jgi:hypothetical protein
MHVDGRVQRGHSRSIGEIDVRAALDESCRHVVMAVDDREHEGGASVGIGGVEIGAPLGQRPNGAERPFSRGVHDRRPAALGKDCLADVRGPFFQRVPDHGAMALFTVNSFPREA